MADLPSHAVHKLSKHEVPYSRPSTPGEHHQTLQIGWVGLGAMGYRMARNLARYHANHPRGSPPLLVWNRSIGKAHNLVKEVGADKASVAQSLAEIATKCDVIICSLANDAVVKSVYHQFAEVLKERPPTKDKTFVETSTIYPTVAGELDSIISAIPHCHLLTSPIFGPPAMADTAKLIIAMSGNYGCKKQVAYLLVPAIGRRVLDLGGNLEKAPTFKLIGNSLVLGVLELLAEAFTLAEKTGVGEELVQEYVKELMPAPLMIAYGEKMLHDTFDGSKGFEINGGIKDAAYVPPPLTCLHAY
ncbi:hypothetical protein EWM64_g10407 [Hericium alpestre]|uniref:6-phosphogluconate dehydrogenase NADP-binding domain-containing protein n=1 Tax=Hericium alpestre TaxID=135208 RepID=A0A4Y9ZFS4_9AGAM|nr:hypothetical protein EWM64_g10407 [Hericium alpestre]